MKKEQEKVCAMATAILKKGGYDQNGREESLVNPDQEAFEKMLIFIPEYPF